MKHAKKAVMVPESEYLALLSMLKGGDYLQNERAQVETKIQQNLADPKTTPTIKAKKHEWLYKKRRQLKEISENRPQKVTIENAEALSSSLAPYLGVHPPPEKLEKEKRRVRFREPTRKRRRQEETSGESEYTSFGDTEGETEGEETSSSPIRTALFGANQKTSPKYFATLTNIITKNPEKYGITSDGKITTNFGSAVKNSDFRDSLKFLTGQLQTPPKGFRFFMQKINKDREIAKYFQQQQGKGKLVKIKIKSIKTKGLTRVRPFKPVIWTKMF